MLPRLKKFVPSLALELMSTVLIQLAAGALPVLLGLVVALRFANVAPWAFLAAGICVTGVLEGEILWWISYQAGHSDRLLELARVDYTTTTVVKNLAERPAPDLPFIDKALTSQVDVYFETMCKIIADGVPMDDKGVALLLLKGNENGAGFVVKNWRNHPDDVILEVEKRLTKQHSWAGKALLVGGGIVELADSRQATPDSGWVGIDNLRFNGHAAVAVRPETQPYAIGILCFDTRHRLRLTRDDRRLLIVFADKIANLWGPTGWPLLVGQVEQRMLSAT